MLFFLHSVDKMCIIVTENVGSAVSKPKRRPYLLKRKALTTSIFDTSRKEADKGNLSYYCFVNKKK